jgi:integrase
LTDIRRVSQISKAETMAKTLTESQITTRAARSKLASGVHWRRIDATTHLGYRKGKRTGVWLVRWRHGTGYRQTPLGTADDELQAGTLSYDAANKAAAVKVEEARGEAKAAAAGAPLTVRDAIESYAAKRDARDSRRKGRAVRSDARTRLTRYVLSAPLADVMLHALTESDLETWRRALPDELKGATKQRMVNDLKAALNAAYGNHRKRLDPVLPAVIKHALRADPHDNDDAEPLARDNQILKDAEIGRLIRAAGEVDAEQGFEGDLYRLVVVMAATGARFSQVARMRVADCQRADKRLMVPESRKGKGRTGGSVPVPVGADVLDALRPVVTGRPKTAPLLERWRHRQVSAGAGGIRWERAGRGPWQSASELTRAWSDIRERAKLPEVIPYTLRHSSIVRGIRANLPIRLVAALHDTSAAMIERHYGRWIVDGLEELAAQAVVPLVPPPVGAKVMRLRRPVSP